MKILDKPLWNIKFKILHTYYLRAMDRFMINYFNGNGLIGVEIGVCSGKHADAMLHNLNINKLYLIDPYIYYDGISNVFDFNKCEINAKKLLKPFKNKIEFIKEYSEDAIIRIPDNVDFVYIDGNHNYEYVMKDIVLYWDKIKKGGILGGHDFSTDFPDVINAVLKFTLKNNLKLKGHTWSNDWFVIKPI